MSTEPFEDVLPRPDGTFCWVDLKTRDPGATAAFFAAVLGWSFEIDQDSWRQATVITTGGGHRIGGLSDLSAAIYPPETPAHIAHYLAVTALDARVAAAVEAGAQVLVPPFDAGDDGRIATLLDPFGVAVSLWQRTPCQGWTHPPETVAAPGRLRHLSASPVAAAEFYPRAFGMTDHNAEFAEFDKGNAMAGWNLIVTVDSVAEIERRAAGLPSGSCRAHAMDGRSVAAELTGPDGLTFFVES
ncbi:VOC family protein [Nocardia carnea]|uniref:VOC family protein n=1 Tax=Nocardia carnea TaxID=37328 RepID=UPI002456ACB8|nr:VOC family protein [Nocardia carnea]